MAKPYDRGLQQVMIDQSSLSLRRCLRWNLDKGNAVVFKSLTPSRIQENVDVFDFSLSEDDLQKLDALTTPEVVQEAQGSYMGAV